MRRSVSWRDDGLLTLLSQVFLFALKRGRILTFPPPRHVGRVSGSSAGGARILWRQTSIRRLPRRYRVGIFSARLWRLICVWEMRPLHSPPRRSGLPSGSRGKGSADDGADGSTRRIGTISTSTLSLARARIVEVCPMCLGHPFIVCLGCGKEGPGADEPPFDA